MTSPPAKTSLFRSNQSQAVRLPKAVAFPEDVRDVRVIATGKGRLVVPANAVWDDFLDSPGLDLPDRHQPDAPSRDPW